MDLHIQLIQKISRFLARIQPASIFVPFQNGFLTFKCTMLPSYHECIVVLQDWHTFIPGSYLQFSLDALSFTMMLLGNPPLPRQEAITITSYWIYLMTWSLYKIDAQWSAIRVMPKHQWQWQAHPRRKGIFPNRNNFHPIKPFFPHYHRLLTIQDGESSVSFTWIQRQ